MDFGLTGRIFSEWELFPLHAGVQHAEDVVEHSMITDLAAWPAFRERQVGQDEFVKLLGGQLHRNRLKNGPIGGGG